jgi:hypothetical protein
MWWILPTAVIGIAIAMTCFREKAHVNAGRRRDRGIAWAKLETGPPKGTKAVEIDVVAEIQPEPELIVRKVPRKGVCFSEV